MTDQEAAKIAAAQRASALKVAETAIGVAAMSDRIDDQRQHTGMIDQIEKGLVMGKCVTDTEGVMGLQALGLTVAEGVFGADMQVEIHNDGPVTLIVESP